MGAKGKKFSNIKALRCFDRVHEMLSYGYPAKTVAKYIIEQGEYTWVTFNSLKEMIGQYRREEILPRDVMACRMPDIMLSAKKTYTDKLEDLRRMDLLHEKVLSRLDREMAKEDDSGVTDIVVDRMVRELLKIETAMHQAKMDLGISGQRHIGTLTVSPERLAEIRDRYGEGAASAMADPVSRARVLAVLKAAQDRADMMDKDEEED
jgi:hypothetical protein